jgi:hypothetical protein
MKTEATSVGGGGAAAWRHFGYGVPELSSDYNWAVCPLIQLANSIHSSPLYPARRLASQEGQYVLHDLSRYGIQKRDIRRGLHLI